MDVNNDFKTNQRKFYNDVTGRVPHLLVHVTKSPESIMFGFVFMQQTTLITGRFLNMILQDRLVAGFLAGVAGGVAMNVYVQIAWFLNATQVRYLDWASVLLYGHRPHGVGDAVFAQIVQIVFAGILGILFAYLIPLITSRYYLFRGFIFGLSVWFLIYSFTLLYGLHVIVPLEVLTAAVDFVGAGIYGLVLAASLHLLDKMVDVQ